MNLFPNYDAKWIISHTIMNEKRHQKRSTQKL